VAIEWKRLPNARARQPYDGSLVLLAVPNQLTAERIDPEHHYTVHIASWDTDDERWVTNEVDETTGKPRSFPFAEPVLWASINLPTLSLVGRAPSERLLRTFSRTGGDLSCLMVRAACGGKVSGRACLLKRSGKGERCALSLANFIPLNLRFWRFP
jgi:hypothetical protein